MPTATKKDKQRIRRPRRSRRPEETRAAVVESALRLFAANGVGETSVPAIAADAGVAVGTLYCYFSSKEVLANFLICDSSQALCKYLWEGFPTDASFRHQFGFFWRRYINFAIEHQDAFKFLQDRAKDLDMDNSSQEAMATLEETENWILDRGHAVGELLHLQTAALSALVHGTARALSQAHLDGRLTLDEFLISQTENCCWAAIAKA